MSRASWRGVVALILASGLAATLIIVALETVWHPGSITSQESTLLATVLGGVVGALAVWLGGHTPGNGNEKRSRPDSEPPADTEGGATD